MFRRRFYSTGISFATILGQASALAINGFRESRSLRMKYVFASGVVPATRKQSLSRPRGTPRSAKSHRRTNHRW